MGMGLLGKRHRGTNRMDLLVINKYKGINK